MQHLFCNETIFFKLRINSAKKKKHLKQKNNLKMPSGSNGKNSSFLFVDFLFCSLTQQFKYLL